MPDVKLTTIHNLFKPLVKLNESLKDVSINENELKQSANVTRHAVLSISYGSEHTS